MNDTKLNVFIQNLKDTTTVLQQLELCIKNLKSVLGLIDDLDIDNINTELNELQETVDTLSNNIKFEHRITFKNIQFAPNVTISLVVPVLSNKNEAYTKDKLLEDLENSLIPNKFIFMPFNIGDANKTFIYGLYYYADSNQFILQYSQFTNSTLSFSTLAIDANTITIEDLIY